MILEEKIKKYISEHPGEKIASTSATIEKGKITHHVHYNNIFISTAQDLAEKMDLTLKERKKYSGLKEEDKINILNFPPKHIMYLYELAEQRGLI